MRYFTQTKIQGEYFNQFQVQLSFLDLCFKITEGYFHGEFEASEPPLRNRSCREIEQFHTNKQETKSKAYDMYQAAANDQK